MELDQAEDTDEVRRNAAARSAGGVASRTLPAQQTSQQAQQSSRRKTTADATPLPTGAQASGGAGPTVNSSTNLNAAFAAAGTTGGVAGQSDRTLRSQSRQAGTANEASYQPNSSFNPAMRTSKRDSSGGNGQAWY